MPELLQPLQPPSGHVFRVERKRGPVWYAKYRLPDGRQVQRKIGPAWTERGRPPAGYFTKRTAEEWLRDVLDEARRGTLPGMVRTGATFADAAAEYLRYVEHDRGASRRRCRATARRSKRTCCRRLASSPIEAITTEGIERWIATVGRSPRTRNKLLILLHGIFGRARKLYGLPGNPVADVEKFPQRRSGDIEVFSPEEVWALVRAAASEQDAAIYLTAAFTGLRRGELLALRWRDVDFAGLGDPRPGELRRGCADDAEVGQGALGADGLGRRAALARLGAARVSSTGDDDLVFVGELGDYLDGSALRRRYKAALARAGLRPLRFHDLRHTFGTRMIAKADIRRVQEWMGHADIQTTMKYLHYAPREEDAALVAEAFRLDEPAAAHPNSLG